MSCLGPFLYGTSADPYCGCQCENKCCPPPCCTSVTVVFEVGSDYSEQFPKGCDCILNETPGVSIAGSNDKDWETRLIGKNLIPFPKFDKNKFKRSKIGDNFVFALDNSCSVPCEILEIVLVTDGCCLEIVDPIHKTNYPANTPIRVVGDGTVTGTYIAGFCSFTLDINNSGSSVLVKDGTLISVNLTMNGESASCCKFCQVEVRCAPYNFTSAGMFYRSRSIKNGTGSGYLNIEKLIEKIKRLRRRKP